MPETVRGVVDKTYHSSLGFSAGVLKTDDGHSVRFAGKFCANEGDVIALANTAVVIDHVFRHDKQRYTFNAYGGTFDTRQHQVNDVLVHVLVAT